VDSTIADGAKSSDMTRNTLTALSVTIGDVPAQVIFSGLSPQFAGGSQIEVMILTGSLLALPYPCRFKSTEH